MEFMERYASDLRGRDSRLADLQARWFATAGGGGAGGAEARDGRAAAEWFAQLGWRGSGGGAGECQQCMRAALLLGWRVHLWGAQSSVDTGGNWMHR